jgi:predicted ArsR family transcriptional regulator
MAKERRTDLASVAPLADAVRRRLYEYVVGQGVPVDRDGAAAGVGIRRPLAAFHLDRLAEAGLLDVEFHRRSGRTGPGAGRPAKFYRRSDREINLSLPTRRYDLAAEIFAEGIEHRPEAVATVLEAARARGAELAETASAGEAGRDTLLGLLRDEGYQPFIEPDGVVRLRNCPFDALVDGHRQLTCSLNLALLQAMAARVGSTHLAPVAQPREGFCCVALVPDP